MMKLIFLFLFVSMSLFASELTLHVAPSAKGMDWSTPGSAIKSSLSNKMSFSSYPFGHVFVTLQCDSSKETTSLISKNVGVLSSFLFKLQGFGVFFESFEGSLQSEKDALEDINALKKDSRLYDIQISINDAQCNRALRYLKEFREKNVAKLFGMSNRPRYAEGGNSASFAVSVAEVIDVLNYDMKVFWIHSLQVPSDLIGIPVHDKYVFPFSILSHMGSWAKSGEAYKVVSFWNPDKMVNWVKEKTLVKNSYYEGTPTGVKIDKSHMPSPEGPIWLQHLDQSLKKVSK